MSEQFSCTHLDILQHFNRVTQRKSLYPDVSSKWDRFHRAQAQTDSLIQTTMLFFSDTLTDLCEGGWGAHRMPDPA